MRILKNREKRNNFRQWRKNYLDNKRLELVDKQHQNKVMIEREKQLKRMISTIKSKGELNEEDKQTIEEHTNEITNINKDIKQYKKKYDSIENVLTHHDKSRCYVMDAASRDDYNVILHNSTNDEYKQDKILDTFQRKKSKKVKVSKSPDYDLLRWGLYPKDVSFN